MKIITLAPEEFDHYAYNHPYGTYFQSSEYGELMKKHGFQIHYIGFADDDGKIHAASLILYRSFFSVYKYAYAPRGFLIDYNDHDLLKLFTIRLRRLLRKQGFIFIKIDPFVPHMEKYKDGSIKSEQNTHIIDSLKGVGYIHQGYNKNFETVQPRCNAIVDLNKSLEYLFFSFDKHTQNCIQIALKYGVNIYKGNKEDIKDLYDITKEKHNNKIDFYYDYYNIFKDKNMIDIYYAKLNTTTLLEKSNEIYDKESERNLSLIDRLQKSNANEKEELINLKMESDELLGIYKRNVIEATHLYKNHPDGINIASSLVITYNKKLYFILDGCDQRYKKYYPSYLLKWLVIIEYLKLGYQYANLNGIHGDYDKKNKYDGINEFKLGFSNIATELIGEFDMPIKSIMYHLLMNSRLIIKFLLRTSRKINNQINDTINNQIKK